MAEAQTGAGQQFTMIIKLKPRSTVVNGCEQHHLSYRRRPRITMSMLPSCVLTAFASPSFSLADLRSQTPVIIVGFILLAVGMAAVTLFFFRRKSRDLGLIYFRIFSVLYAVRLLLRMRVVRSLAGVSDSLVITSIYGLPSPF
jgi:hypothetical protein